ncbi:MAG: murein biosynthesis integral membrane protein MurJ [Polyangiaceae bacterium]
MASSSSSSPTPSASSRGDAERRAITGRAGIVAAGTLASRLLGLVRDQTLAALFSRAATDAFFVAFTIPNVLRQLLAEGAVQNAVLPVLSKTKEQQGDAAAHEFFRALRGLSLLILIVVSVLGVWLAPALVDLFAHGYRDEPGQFERTVTVTRWVFPYIFFMGTAALGVAALNVEKRFVVTSFAPGLLNVAFIACAFGLPTWLTRSGHDAILAMAIGALLGGLLQVVAQWPSLRATGYLSLPTLRLSHPALRETLRRMGPVLIGLGVYYVDVVLARRFLSELGQGAQSYFAWALRLCDFPQGIFVMALSSATLPSLAALAARGDAEEVAKTFAYGLRLALFVGLAATALLVSCAEPLVVLIFQRGAFDATAAHETAKALMAQGLGIWAVAAVRQLVSVYYALGDTRTPVVVAALDLGVFVVLALTLRVPFGHVGIGLAVAGASIAQMAMLFLGLRGKLSSLHLGELFGSAARTLGACAVAAIAAWSVAGATAQPPDASAWWRLVPGIAAGSSFGLAFLMAAWLLRSQELHVLSEGLLRRLRRR